MRRRLRRCVRAAAGVRSSAAAETASPARVAAATSAMLRKRSRWGEQQHNRRENADCQFILRWRDWVGVSHLRTSKYRSRQPLRISDSTPLDAIAPGLVAGDEADAEIQNFGTG